MNTKLYLLIFINNLKIIILFFNNNIIEIKVIIKIEVLLWIRQYFYISGSCLISMLNVLDAYMLNLTTVNAILA